MTREEAKEYAKNMTYRNAVCNALQGKCIPYRKATLIKLYELLDTIEPRENEVQEMTREDAIESLNEINETIFGGGLKSIPMAINALEQEPCEQIKWERDTAIKQLNELGYGLGEKIEPCEDVVSRKDVENIVNKYIDGSFQWGAMLVEIKRLPSVKPAERVGRWIELKDGYDDEYYECTICGTPLDTIVGTPDDNGFNFCPHCGCLMKGEDE